MSKEFAAMDGRDKARRRIALRNATEHDDGKYTMEQLERAFALGWRNGYDRGYSGSAAGK